MRPESRDALRAAIAKARGWIDDIRLGRISSFAGIAERCGPGRTAHPPAGSPRLPVAPHHCDDRRWHRACGPHRHHSCADEGRDRGGSPRRHHQGPGWIDDIRLDCISSFAEIAEREAQGERHIRLLAPLAFLSPHIFAAIVNGTAPADLTVTGLAKALPYSWAEQEERVGLSL